MPRGVRPVRQSGLLRCVWAWCVMTGLLVGCATKGTGDDLAEAVRNEDAFTGFVVGRLQEKLPDRPVRIVGRLSAEVGDKGGVSYQVNFDRIWNFCRRAGGQCRAEVDQYVSGTASSIAARVGVESQQIDRAALRIIVRPEAMVTQLREVGGADPAGRPVARHFVGGLWAVVALDYPKAIAPLTRRNLERLGITADEALDAGWRNTAATQRPLASVIQPPMPGKFGYLRDGDYEPSRMYDHAGWAEIANAMPGGLIVAVPARNLLLYGGGPSRQRVDALRMLAHELGRRSTAPLSPEVFRWTPAGWEVEP